MALQPGFYQNTASTDPWTYIVTPKGEIIVAEGNGNPRTVREGSEAHAAILDFINRGQIVRDQSFLEGSADRGVDFTEDGKINPTANVAPIDKQPTPLREAKQRGAYSDRLDEVTGEKMAKPEPAPEPDGDEKPSKPMVGPGEGVAASKGIAKGLAAVLPGTAIGSAAGRAGQAGYALGENVVNPAIAAVKDRVEGAPQRWADRAMSMLEAVASDDEKGVLASLKARLYGREQ